MAWKRVLYALFLLFTLFANLVVRPAATIADSITTASGDASSEAVPSEAVPNYVLKVSIAADRKNAVDLDGQSVTDNIYVFISPEDGVTSVRFYLDNPSANGTPRQTEHHIPWDFAGGNRAVANAFDTTELPNGTHSITAAIRLRSGQTVVSTGSFVVNNIIETPQITYTNLLSKSSDRTAALDLAGQTVAGKIYVFLGPAAEVTRVRFYLDNPQAAGAPVQVERNPPWDFAGGNTETANAFDTTRLTNGPHSITASVRMRGRSTAEVTASFIVNNPVDDSPPTRTPAPAPTATRGPEGGSIYWGVAMKGMPGDMNRLSAWEGDIAGKGASIVHWGHFWNDRGEYRKWSDANVDNVRSHGSIPMISWTPEGGDPQRWQLRRIIEGEHDSYIRQFAAGARSWAYPFLLRIMHEMNGSWGYPWQETENDNQRGEFVQAWRHIIDIFRQEGVANASYVWCPNVDYPGSDKPSFASLYPGDEYVDWTCLDGYNWGTNRSSGWQSFDQVYSYSYNEILKIAPDKPMMIGEFGSVEEGGSKADWLTDALVQIPGAYNRIRAALYFDWEFDGVDWRISSSAAATAAWKAGIGSSYYAANGYGAIEGKVAVP